MMVTTWDNFLLQWYCHSKANPFQANGVQYYTWICFQVAAFELSNSRNSKEQYKNLQQQILQPSFLASLKNKLEFQEHPLPSTCFRTPWEEGDIMHSEANQIQDPESRNVGVSWWPMCKKIEDQCASSSQATVSKGGIVWREFWLIYINRIGTGIFTNIEELYQAEGRIFENGKSDNSRSRW